MKPLAAKEDPERRLTFALMLGGHPRLRDQADATRVAGQAVEVGAKVAGKALEAVECTGQSEGFRVDLERDR